MNDIFDRFEPLSHNALENIHSASLYLLNHTGVLVESERARNIFKEHGCKTDGKKVFIPEPIVTESMKALPSQYLLRALDSRNDQIIGGGHYAFGANGGSSLISDWDGCQRRPTMKDVDDFYKLMQWAEPVTINTKPVFPSDVNPAYNYHFLLYSQIIHTDNVLNINEHTIDMLCIAHGIDLAKLKSDAERGIYYAYSSLSPVSPLELTALQTDAALVYAELGIVNNISSMPIAGISAPVPLESVIVLRNAEQLAGIILCALVNPKAPLLYGTLGTVGNMRTGGAPVGVPEEAILEAAGAQLARFYGIPSRGNCGWTSALECDYQSGAETALRAYNTVRCGINVLFGLGDLTSLAQGSKEKFILDVETVENVRRIMRPLDFTTERICLDLIDSVGHKNSYLQEKHTLKHFKREFHQPRLFNHMTYEAWERESRIHLIEKAHRKVQQILETFQMPDRDPGIRRDLDRLFKKKNIL